jgi:hypothetical protein
MRAIRFRTWRSGKVDRVGTCFEGPPGTRDFAESAAAEAAGVMRFRQQLAVVVAVLVAMPVAFLGYALACVVIAFKTGWDHAFERLAP